MDFVEDSFVDEVLQELEHRFSLKLDHTSDFSIGSPTTNSTYWDEQRRVLVKIVDNEDYDLKAYRNVVDDTARLLSVRNDRVSIEDFYLVFKTDSESIPIRELNEVLSRERVKLHIYNSNDLGVKQSAAIKRKVISEEELGADENSSIINTSQTTAEAPKSKSILDRITPRKSRRKGKTIEEEGSRATTKGSNSSKKSVNSRERVSDPVEGNLEGTEDLKETGALDKQLERDKIPFHLDNVEAEDRLNREPIAKSLAKLISKEIFSAKDFSHAFMIHLQGEWGSGKSTFLNLLSKHLKNDKKWMIVHYNAWQNQHITPPWWTLLNQLYLQSLKELKGFEKFRFIIKEGFRRLMKYGSGYKLFSLAIFITLLVLTIIGIDAIKDTLFLGEEGEDSKMLVVESILTVSSFVGVIYSFSKFITTPILLKNSNDASSFMEKAMDPMSKIKKHFNGLVGDLNSYGIEVAVFIDDVDRCNIEYNIQLLEGIQTLFKDKRVLYVVAGDKNWLTTCFENCYEDFKEKVVGEYQNLGDLFLEKAFQLSVRMPRISESSKKEYWDHIIGDIDHKVARKALDEDELIEIKKQVVSEYSTLNEDKNWLEGLKQDYKLSDRQISNIAIEALDESKEDVKHLLKNHYRLITPNPRSIKRLANNYTMYRNTLIAEQKNFDPNKIFRWLLIKERFPKIGSLLLEMQEYDLDKIKDKFELNPREIQVLEYLMLDEEGEFGGKLTVSEIRTIVGVS